MDVAEPTMVIPPAAAVFLTAENLGEAAMSDLEQCELPAQSAAQESTGATLTPESPSLAKPATEKGRALLGRGSW